MGAANLDLTVLDLGQPQDVTLELKDPARPRQHLGEIFLTVTLWPRNQQEKEQVLLFIIHFLNFFMYGVMCEMRDTSHGYFLRVHPVLFRSYRRSASWC